MGLCRRKKRHKFSCNIPGDIRLFKEEEIKVKNETEARITFSFQNRWLLQDTYPSNLDWGGQMLTTGEALFSFLISFPSLTVLQGETWLLLLTRIQTPFDLTSVFKLRDHVHVWTQQNQHRMLPWEPIRTEVSAFSLDHNLILVLEVLVRYVLASLGLGCLQESEIVKTNLDILLSLQLPQTIMFCS